LTRLPRLLMGAILIGLVSNLPEFAVSLTAIWHPEGAKPTMALGNAIGSNIANTGLVLGVCLVQGRAMIEPNWLRGQAIPMFLACVLLYGVVLFTDVTFSVGLLLVALCVFYVVWSVSTTKPNQVDGPSLQPPPPEGGGLESVAPASRTANELATERRAQWAIFAVLMVLSIPLVLVSSRMVLYSAVDMARAMDISETVIALTLVAAGTSLPELATALAAYRKGHADTSLGIILGSNIYNALGVIGLSGLFIALPVSAANRLFDLPVMLLLFVVLLTPVLLGRTPGRRTGYVLLGIYALYSYSMYTLYGIFT
jgi:cation:H+ antiporter